MKVGLSSRVDLSCNVKGGWESSTDGGNSTSVSNASISSIGRGSSSVSTIDGSSGWSSSNGWGGRVSSNWRSSNSYWGSGSINCSLSSKMISTGSSNSWLINWDNSSVGGGLEAIKTLCRGCGNTGGENLKFLLMRSFAIF